MIALVSNVFSHFLCFIPLPNRASRICSCRTSPSFVMTNSGCTVRDYSCMQMTSNASQDDGSWPRQDLHYISIHYPGPRPCTTQMNSFFTGQRNLICSWWWCCQLCSRNCISSLNNEKLHNFSTPAPPLGRARPECTAWTWHHGNAGKYSYRCKTWGSISKSIYSQISISGSRTCRQSNKGKQ